MNDLFADKSMGDSDRERLDRIRVVAHEQFIAFQNGTPEQGLATLITLREGFRMLEFSMKNGNSRKALIRKIDNLKQIAHDLIKNHNLSNTYGAPTNKKKYKHLIAEIDITFSKFYELRQKAGLGVKTITEEEIS